MNLNRDIKSSRVLQFKGALFFMLGLLAGGMILSDSPRLKTAALLLVCVWAFCRFYYFLFYVLERYAGREQPFAGVWDALRYLFKKRRQ